MKDNQDTVLIELNDEITQIMAGMKASWSGLKISELHDVDAALDYLVSSINSVIHNGSDPQKIVMDMLAEDVREEFGAGEFGLAAEGVVVFAAFDELLSLIIKYLEIHVEDIHNAIYDISVAKLWPTGRVVLRLSKGDGRSERLLPKF